jgi:hypothetical protein
MSRNRQNTICRHGSGILAGWQPAEANLPNVIYLRRMLDESRQRFDNLRPRNRAGRSAI